MSEKMEYLSKKALLIIGITSLAILVIGLILYFTGFNEAFYSTSDTVQAIFKAITYLGEPIAFIIIIAIIYITYNKKYAKNLAVCLLFSQYLNQLCKSIFQDPRPVATNIGDEYGFAEPSFGFPSGHTQNSTVIWGNLSKEFKDNYKYNNVPVIPIVLSIIIFLVAISRMIIGVHDLQDVIGGFLIGIGFLLLFIYTEPFFSKQFNKLNFIAKIILTATVAILLFLIGTLVYPNAGLGLVVPPVLYADDGAYAQVGGALLGFGIGYLLEQEYVKYDPSQLTNKKKFLNIIITIVVLLLVFVPFEYLLKIDSVYYRFARYAFATFILGYIVPLLCSKINK
ncbi:MAG: phosphatase PAP2 family protein [Promethearchaeota archaeon]|nr:MAG: phosphatase PAP2 family protein [Candidatus Lokiarchaeota archaeon]